MHMMSSRLDVAAQHELAGHLAAVPFAGARSSGWNATPRRRSSMPSSRRTLTAFGAICMPAPTRAKAGACSNTCTLWPARVEERCGGEAADAGADYGDSQRVAHRKGANGDW